MRKKKRTYESGRRGGRHHLFGPHRVIKEQLAEENPEAILFDGLDEALIGHGNQYTKSKLAVYSVRKILEVLERSMSYQSAQEWFDYNIACLWAGDETPILVYDEGC